MFFNKIIKRNGKIYLRRVNYSFNKPLDVLEILNMIVKTF